MRRDVLFLRAVLCVVLALAALPLAAQPDDAPPVAIPYASLSATEREQLQPFAKDWDTLPPQRQARLRRAAARWAQMPSEQRAQMQERFQRWQALKPEERAALRERFRAFRAMPAEQQDRVRRGVERFRHLPPEERARMREEFRRMSPDERRAFLQGAGNERRALARERWLSSIPDAEREPMRAMIDGFTPPQRKTFRQLLVATPAAQRAALRQEFLRLTPQARAQRLDAMPPR